LFTKHPINTGGSLVKEHNLDVCNEMLYTGTQCVTGEPINSWKEKPCVLHFTREDK